MNIFDNSDIKTDIKEHDLFENSEKKTDNEELNIFVNSDIKTDIKGNDPFENNEKKADNEKTKDPSQRSGKNKGCQEDLEESLIEEDFKKEIDVWGEFSENENASGAKSQILKKYKYDKNGAREKVEQKISEIGTEKCRIYFQDEANKENSDEPLNKTMTKARNWTETIIVALLCSMVLYTICLLYTSPSPRDS